MSFTNTPTSPTAVNFNSVKEYIVSGLKLSTNIAPANTPNNSPMRPTAPEFRKTIPPHLKAIAARSASVVSTGSSTSSTATVKSIVSTDSSTGSTATTTKSYTTPISWKDQCALENALDVDTTAKLLARLDPSKPLVCGPPFSTKPITNSRDRAITHKILERVWDGRLVHETEYKTSIMHIWVRGSRVPNWLQRLHENRSKNATNKGDENSIKKDNAAMTGNENHLPTIELDPRKSGKPLTSLYPARKLAAMRAAGVIPSTAPTGAFAKARAQDARPKNDAKAEELRQNFIKSAQAFKASVKKEEERAAAAGPQVHTGHNFIEIYVDKKRHAVHQVQDVQVEEPKRTTATIPPHLRKKMMMEAAAAKEAEASKDTTWVAAKLPTPFASE